MAAGGISDHTIAAAAIERRTVRNAGFMASLLESELDPREHITLGLAIAGSSAAPEVRLFVVSGDLHRAIEVPVRADGPPARVAGGSPRVGKERKCCVIERQLVDTGRD